MYSIVKNLSLREVYKNGTAILSSELCFVLNNSTWTGLDIFDLILGNMGGDISRCIIY